MVSKGLKGGRVNTEDYELVFKKAADQTKRASSIQSAAPVSAEKKETDFPKKDHLPVELRMYMSGTTVNIIARSENPDHYHFSELTFPETEWNGFDIYKFKNILRTKEWPGCISGA